MAQSPSTSWAFHGFLRSSHALLCTLALILVFVLGISLQADFPFGAYFACVLLAAIILPVLHRFIFKGPEGDRGQPAVTVTHQDNRVQTTHIVNVEPTQDILAIISAVQHRHALPMADGIIQGVASNPDDVRPITPEMAQALRERDSQTLFCASIESADEPSA